MNDLRKHREQRGHDLLKRMGYETKGHPDAKQDRSMISEMIHKHEKHLHKGEPLTKYARGGRANHRGTHINIINLPQATPRVAPIPLPIAQRPVPPVAPRAPLGAPTAQPMRRGGRTKGARGC